MDINLDHFVDVLFKQNKNNLFLAIGADLRSTKDVFCFCLDVLTKGLLLLYGRPNSDGVKKVDLDLLTSDNLDFVKSRMSLCGIKVHSRTLPVTIYTDAGLNIPTHQRIELPDLKAYTDADPLESYKIDIFTQGLHIQLHFELCTAAFSQFGFAHSCHH